MKFLSDIRDFKWWLNRNNKIYYYGNYNTFFEAYNISKKNKKDYASESILERVANSTNLVREGKAVYEQDGVPFYEEKNEFELISSLMYIFVHENAQINIVDFGGGLGSLFFRYKKYLPQNRLSWNIIEQDHFVTYGKENIPEINFFYDIKEFSNSVDKGKNVLLLSSVLPYLEKPYDMLKELLNTDISYVIIDETVFNTKTEYEKIVLQHVPEFIYSAEYPSWILSEQKLLQSIESEGFKMIWNWIYPFGSVPIIKFCGKIQTVDKGFLFKREVN